MSHPKNKNAAYTEKAEAFHAQIHRLRQQVVNHWWILLLTVAIGLFIETMVTLRLQSFYKSEGKIISNSGILISGTASQTEALGDYIDTQISLMESEIVRKQANDLMARTHPELVPSDVKIEAGQNAKTSIFVLTAVGKDKKYTQALLGAVMAEYLQFRKNQQSTTTTSAQENIKQKMVEQQREIDEQDNAIADWEKKYSLTALKEEGNYAAKYVAELKQRMAEQQTEYELLNSLSLDQQVQRKGDRGPDTSNPLAPVNLSKVSGVAADYLEAVRTVQLVELERTELSQYLKPKHPKIIQLTEKIARAEATREILKKQAAKQLVTQRDALQADIENNRKQIAVWEPKAVELNQRIGEYARMDQKRSSLKAELESNQQALNSVNMKTTSEPETMTIMASASEALPIHQGIVKALVIGILGGLIVGVGILLLINQFDDRIRSFSEMQGAFDFPVIGHVPKSEVTDQPLLVENDTRHMLFESFRNIRSSIFFMPFEGARPKTILITSSIPHEGKSTVSSNFAVTLAMSGAKTLLVDADMRRGALHDLFKMTPTPGLAEILGGGCTLKEAIKTTEVQNLSFIPRGKGTLAANDLLLGKHTDAFIKKVYADYDYIVFDSAPVLAADDTSNLAPKVDGVIFVVRASFTQSRLARRTLDLLVDRQVNILGLIFNYANTSAADYPYYRYEEYHKQAAT